MPLDSAWVDAFKARFHRMMHICGPPSWPTIFSTHADVLDAKACLESGSGDVVAARRLVEASCHPDTGRPIALPFRMAFHVPANTVLVFGMLTSTSPVGSAFWQFANQTFNACQFYANRNASNHIPDEHLLLSYVGSVTSSVSIAVLLRRWLANPSPSRSPSLAWWLSMMVPFFAAAAAKPLQIGLMRVDEVRQGVIVYDALGGDHGRSKRAGFEALGQTIFTRSLYLAPPMLLPPILMAKVPTAWPAVARNVLYATSVGCCSAFATPACIALFDQRASLPAGTLEPQFHGVVDAKGSPVDRFWFNKGI